jgi:hypothetical protein
MPPGMRQKKRCNKTFSNRSAQEQHRTARRIVGDIQPHETPRAFARSAANLFYIGMRGRDTRF